MTRARITLDPNGAWSLNEAIKIGKYLKGFNRHKDGKGHNQKIKDVLNEDTVMHHNSRDIPLRIA